MGKLALFLLAAACCARAETGYDAWLRYATLDPAAQSKYREALPAVIATIGASPLLESARDEIVRGVRGMIGRTLREETGIPEERRHRSGYD